MIASWELKEEKKKTHSSTERLNSAVTCQTRSARGRQDQKFWKDKSRGEVRGLTVGGGQGGKKTLKQSEMVDEAEEVT